jgi:chemotaxis family two-component system sensor kinase Cph1
VPSGHVDISWSELGGQQGEQRLHLNWVERGGPAVATPVRKGFGSRLVTEGLAYELDGEVGVEYLPAGVLCTVDVPIEPAGSLPEPGASLGASWGAAPERGGLRIGGLAMSEAPTGAIPVRCVLVVEDEMIVAMMLEGLLTDLGYRVIKAARVGRAVGLAATEAIDAAILDVNLAGETSYPVADELRRRGIPFVFASGYAPDSLRADFRDTPVLRKPYVALDVRRLLSEILGPRSPAG